MIEFLPFKLDPDTVRLYKNEEVIETEPQVFNTLLFLIENRDRVVSKDELFEKIWHGRAVTDHVITRIIYELRKILDNKEVDESHIRTIRRKGYQFVAEVTVHTKESQQKLETAPVKAKSTFGLSVVYSVLILAPLLFGYWYSTQTGANHSGNFSEDSFEVIDSNQVHEYPVVVVLPIQVDSPNEKVSILTLSLIDYLTNQLELNLNMKVIHPDSLVRIDEKMGDIWSIQQSTRAHYIIEGLIDSVNEQSVVLQLNLYKKDQDSELIPFALGTFEFPYPQSSKDLSDLYKQRKVTVRDIISIIKPGIDFNESGGNETADPEAYRMAIAAHHMVRTDACEDMTRAEKLLLRAIERDSEFGFAYHQLFTNYFKRVWLCGDSAEYHQKALRMAQIAEELSPNTYQSLAIGRNTILVESNQVEQAYEFSRHADWNDPAAIYRAVYGLRYAGFLNVASGHLDRILQLDPYYFTEKPIQQSPNTLLYQNRLDEYLALLAEPGNSYHDYYRSLSLVLTENAEEARPILQAVIDRTPNDLFGQYSQALLYVIDNNKIAANELIDNMLSERNKHNHHDGEMTYKLLQLYALNNESEKTLNALQLAVNQGFFPFNYFLVDPALESIRNTAQFKKIIQQAQTRHLAFAQRFDLQSEINTLAN